MTTPWPNATIATANEAPTVELGLHPQDIVRCCHAQMVNDIGQAFMSIGFFSLCLVNGLRSVGIEANDELIEVYIGLPAFGLMLLALFAYLFLGGSGNLAAVSKLYKEPASVRFSTKAIYFVFIALLLILFFVQPWLAKTFNLPKGSYWFVLAGIFAMSFPTHIVMAFTWWQRGRAAAQGSAQH
jgi:hypothetical protein